MTVIFFAPTNILAPMTLCSLPSALPISVDNDGLTDLKVPRKLVARWGLFLILVPCSRPAINVDVGILFVEFQLVLDLFISTHIYYAPSQKERKVCEGNN